MAGAAELFLGRKPALNVAAVVTGNGFAQRCLLVWVVLASCGVTVLENFSGHAQVVTGVEDLLWFADVEMLTIDLSEANAEISPLPYQCFYHYQCFAQALRLTRQRSAHDANGPRIERRFCFDDRSKRGGMY